MPQIFFELKISAQDYVKWYQGIAKQVVIQADNGQIVKFPVNLLQKFVTHEGVFGRFEMEFDESNQFKSLKRISSKGCS